MTADQPSHADLTRVMDAHPMLCNFGYGKSPWAGWNYAADRAALAGNLDQVRTAYAWLRTLHPAGDRPWPTSYGLKHDGEYAGIGYVTNGAMIAAAYLVGVPVRVHPDDPNPELGVALTPPKAPARDGSFTVWLAGHADANHPIGGLAHDVAEWSGLHGSCRSLAVGCHPMALSTEERDGLYQEILLAPLRTSADYLPKMGGGDEVDLASFTSLYGADPLYHWMGFDSPLMFAAHKAAGGMTSIYRQLGIGCERMFRQVLKDELALSEDQVKWSYEILPETEDETKKARILSLDGRVEVGDIPDPGASNRVEDWIEQQRAVLGISVPLKGAVFEVRQGYKSADSKRQNADLANAAQALGHGYLPVLAIMSTQINMVVRARYLTGNWSVLMGTVGENDPLHSTFDFLRDVVGYDIAGFFQRNTTELRAGVERILRRLLEAK